ncbi:MAG: hypothetical protein JJT94_07315 [Bernardetiaceae bacterium]|nr:hypothetical protein [Bernardetiaceae bacterium]
MKIKKISDKILKLCKSEQVSYKESKKDLYDLLNELQKQCFNIANEAEVQVLTYLQSDISKIKNRKASFLEEEIARLILVKLPFRIMRDEEMPDTGREALSETYDEDSRGTTKLNTKLLQYAKEVIASKSDKSRRYEKRLKEAIRLLDELQTYYKIQEIKKIFIDKIQHKDKDIQFFALYGLKNYYYYENAKELTKEEEEELEHIIQTTDKIDIAVGCCQVLLSAGKIDELDAVLKIDDWKYKQYR